MTRKKRSKIDKNNVQFRRSMAIVRALTLSRYGLTKAEIMEKLEECGIPMPCDRTFMRDIKTLNEHGYEIVCDNDYRYILENRNEIISEAFSFEEMQALQMCRDLFTYFDGTHLKSSIDSAINAVIGSQKTRFSNEDIIESRDNFMVHLGWRREFFDKWDLLDTIAYGVNNATRLKAVYKKPNSESEVITIEPYRLVLYHDSLYLLARKITRSAADGKVLRLYQVSRFESIEETDRTFTKNRKLIREYEEKLSHSFGIYSDGELCDIEIDFDKSVEYSIRERLWHKSQKIESKDNCVTLKLRVYKSGEFMTWVRGWGDMIKKVRFKKVKGAAQ